MIISFLRMFVEWLDFPAERSKVGSFHSAKQVSQFFLNKIVFLKERTLNKRYFKGIVSNIITFSDFS